MRMIKQQAQSIVDEMKASIHRDINIMDDSGTIVASTNPARCGKVHQGALRIIREDLPSLTIWKDEPEKGVQCGINLPIRIGGKIEGVIGITGDPKEVSVFGEVIQRMTVIMLEGMYQRDQQTLLEQARGLFVENWLFSEKPDWAELDLRGRLLGFDINAPYIVALLEPVGIDPVKHPEEMRSSLLLQMIREHFQEADGHFCAVVHSKVMVLLCSTDRSQALDRLQRICRDVQSYQGLQVSAGLSNVSTGAEDLRRRYLEARTAERVAAQYPEGKVLFYDQASLEFILQSIPLSMKQDIHDLVFAACTAPEVQEFSQTIRLYFEKGGDIQQCAKVLFIHRNTFQYRIDRLRKKTGYDLRLPKDGLLLYLSI